MSAQVYAQLVEYRCNDSEINKSICNPFRYSLDYQARDQEKFKILSEPIKITHIDFATVQPKAADLGKFSFSVTQPGVVSAVAFWFVLDLGDGIQLDSRDCHWKTALQYLPEVEVTKESVI